MDDAELVRRFQGFGDLLRDRKRLINRHGSLCDPIGERASLDQLHDQRANVGRELEPIDLGDVRMVGCRQCLRFAFESSEPVRIVGERFGQNLQRDIAIELRVPRAIDLTHSALADLSGDFIRAEAHASGQSHGKRLPLQGMPWRSSYVTWATPIP